MEHEHRTLNVTVSDLKNAVAIVALEQTHLKELFTARVESLEKSYVLLGQKIDGLSRDITNMASDAERSPAGRVLRGQIAIVQATTDEHTDKLESFAKLHADLFKWQDRVDGVLLLLKWVGGAGLAAMVISTIHLLATVAK